jgi:O-antigen/teichoic acid export membrane protein
VTDPLQRPEAAGAAMRGGGLRVVAWSISAVLSLVSLRLLVEHLGVAGFGRYVAVLAIVNMAVLGSDLGITALALRDWGALDPERRGGRMFALVRLRFATGAVAGVAAIAFAAVLGWPVQFVAATAIASITIFAQVITDFAVVALSGSLQFRRVVLVETTRAVLGTLLIALLVLADAGPMSFFVAWSSAALATAAVAAFVAAPWLRPLRRARSRERVLPLLSETGRYAAASAVQVVYFRAALIVLSVGVTARQTGLFGAVFRVVEFSAAVGSAVAGAMTPLLARTERDDLNRLRGESERMLRFATAAGLLVALFLEIGAVPVMRLIGGDAMSDAVPVLRITAPAVIATFASFAMGAVLLVLRRYRELLAVNVIALVVILGLASLLVPRYGAQGAAVAVLCAEWVIAAGQAVALRRVLWRRPAAVLSRA